jgi:beta-glucosidase
MKKKLKIALLILGSLVALLILGALIGWLYVKSTFLDIEDDFAEKKDFQEISIEGHTFLDRNGNKQLDVYEDGRKPINVRVKDALSQMTIEEKIHLLKGSGLASALGRVAPGEGIPGAVGTIVPTPRLGLPTVYLSDGPAGLRIEPKREGEERTYYCTAFPIGTLLASTWNTALVQEIGAAMGNEALEYGLDVILGPGANIHRHPFCGRNFEYYSEDPILTGYMGAAMVNGIESNGVGASVKHFVANNQETNRNFNDALISERAMQEIYLKGFEIIVKKAQPWTVMSSYNKVNGTYVAENKMLLTNVLRNDWNFEGLVMSDWFGGNDAPAMIKAGNDLLEPGTKRQWNALIDAQKEGRLTDDEIDVAVSRILTLVIKSRKMQNYKFSNNPDLKAHAQIARRSAAEGVVLLKNSNTLPLENTKNVALLGVTSYDFIAGGTGSGDVNEAYTVSLEEGLKNAGYSINTAAKNIYEKHRNANRKEFKKPEGFKAMFEPYVPPQVIYTIEELDQLAAEADVAIITIGRNAGEGGDRVEKDDFLLTAIEQKMIANASMAFHKVNKPVIVVLNIGGVIETASWREKPNAILLAWQGGQEGGNGVADILSGKINPSGKLPVTFPMHLKNHASNKNFPQDGEPMNVMDMLLGKEVEPEEEKVQNKDYTKYEEDIYVGYRHFDKAKLAVSYPFGHGLSYTAFEYGDLTINRVNDTLHISTTVKNVGKVAGKEVVQVYATLPASINDRPEQELKAFQKTKRLVPEEQQEINFQIPIAELSYWNTNTSGWRLAKGMYSIQLGTSSRAIRSTKEIEL